MDQNNKEVYIVLLLQTLEKKLDCLEKIQKITKEQESILAGLKFEEEAFGQTLAEKESLIEQVNQLDDGFTQVFDKVKELLSQETKNYEAQVKKMQELISKITQMGVSLQALELQNKQKLESVLILKRKEIKQLRKSSSTAMRYYQSMTSQKDESPIFYDKKK